MDSIRIKRGVKAQLPSELPLGELAFCTDTRELYVGMGEGTKPRPVTNTEITEHLAEWKGKYQEVSDQFQTKYEGLEEEYATRLTEVSSQLDTIVHINVKNFGAKGDGVTDDSQAIKNAIDSTTDFANVFFPKGTYKISNNIVIDRQNLRMFGEDSASTLVAESGVTIFEVAKNNGVSNLKIENLRFWGNENSVGAISLGGEFVAFCNLHNLEIRNFKTLGGFGIKLSKTQELNISNCYIADNYDNILYPNVEGNYCTSTSINGKGGYIGRAENIGIRLEKEVCSFVVSDIVIEANKQGGLVAIGKGTDVTIDKVHFEENKGVNTIYVSGTDIGKGKFSLINSFFYGNSKPILRTDYIIDSVVKNNVGLIEDGNIITTENTTLHFELNKSQDVVNNQNAISLYKTLFGNISWFETDTLQKTELSLNKIDFKNIYEQGKLSYYEENSFIPTILCSNSGTINTTSKNGSYTRIGNMVFITCTINVSSVEALNGEIQIGNLPFYVRGRGVANIYSYGLNMTNGYIIGVTEIGQKHIVLSKFENGNVSSLATSMSDNTGIILSVMYMTD